MKAVSRTEGESPSILIKYDQNDVIEPNHSRKPTFSMKRF